MDFYQTVGGRRFVDYTIPTLSKNIEKLTEALNRKTEQYCVPLIKETDPVAVAAIIEDQLGKGAKFVTKLDTGTEGDSVLIFEREVE